MKQTTSNRLILAGLSVLFFLTMFATCEVVAVADGLQTIIDISEKPMQTISQVVTRADGTSATIKTARNTNADGTPEALADWRARHDAAVAEFKNS